MNLVSLLSWLQAWSPLIGIVLTLAGWAILLYSDRSSNRQAGRLTTRNQARVNISTALERYLGYLHGAADPAAVACSMATVNALGIKQNQAIGYAPQLLAQLAVRLKYDPRLGAGGVQMLKGYLPLFPGLEEVIVYLQLVQASIGYRLEQYFLKATSVLESIHIWKAGANLGSLTQLRRTDEELHEIWGQIGVVNDLLEWLNYTVLKSLVRARKRWMWTGNLEYYSCLKYVGARLC